MTTGNVSDIGVIAVDYGISLQEMIAGGNYDWTSDEITPVLFPVQGFGVKRFRTTLFHFGRTISSEDAVAAMTNRQCTPATHVHGLAFGAIFPDEQRKYPIACLGSFAQLYGHRSVVYLGSSNAGRYLLILSGWEGDWGDDWRFLPVQEISAT
jgi:hypothetical protein